MAFPSVSAADTQSGTVASNSTTWTLTYPTNLANGDLIIAMLGRDGTTSTGTWPAGWVVSSLGEASVSRTYAKKKSDGTETGTFNVTSLSSEQGCWRVIRIPAATWQGTLGTEFANTANSSSVTTAGHGTGTSTSPDPISFTPANWSAEDTLWIAFAASDHGDTTYTGFPANFTQHDHTTAGGHAQESGGAGGAGMGVAFRQFNTTSLDVGAFTTDVSEGWSAAVIAVRPAAAAVFNTQQRKQTIVRQAVNRGARY